MIKGHSEKWKLLQAEHLERVRTDLAGRAAQFMRGRLAQTGYLSTSSISSSSWSIDAKQRQLEEAEELRRRAILTIRKAELLDATERFQRATSPLRLRRPSSPLRRQQRPSSAPTTRLQHQAVAPSIASAASAASATPGTPASFYTGQPVIGSWVPAAASTDRKASVAFSRKYGSFRTEQLQPDTGSVESVTGDLPAGPDREQRAHVTGSSAATKQQHRQNAWATLSAPKEAMQTAMAAAVAHSHTVPAAAGTGLGWRPKGLGTGHVVDGLAPRPPHSSMRPSSAGAVMMTVGSRQPSTAADAAAVGIQQQQHQQQLGVGGRQHAVAIPQASAELYADEAQNDWNSDVDRGKNGGATDAADVNDWLASETQSQPSGRAALGMAHGSTSRYAWTAAPASDDAPPGQTTAGVTTMRHVTVPAGAPAAVTSEPGQASFAFRTSGNQGGPGVVELGRSPVTAAASDTGFLVHARETNASHVGETESSSAALLPFESFERGYRVSAAQLSSNDLPAPEGGGTHAPIPPPGRPAERFQRRPMSADFARRSSASSSVAPAATALVASALSHTNSGNGRANTAAAAVAASAADQPGADVSYADMFYIKSRTESKPKETASGPVRVAAQPTITTAAAAVVATPARAEKEPVVSTAATRAAVTAAAPALDTAAAAGTSLNSRAMAGGSLSVTAALSTGSAVAAGSCWRPGSGGRTAATSHSSSATTGAATAVAAAASASVSPGDVAVPVSSRSNGEAERDTRQPRSILKRPASACSSSSVAGGAANSNGGHLATEERLADYWHANGPLEADTSVGRHNGGTRRKSVRFSDDGSHQLAGSAHEGMNGPCGGASVGAPSPNLSAWRHDIDTASVLQLHLQTGMAAMPPPTNSPVNEHVNEIGGAMSIAADRGGMHSTLTSEVLLNREQQPKRVLPAATPVVSQNEQQQLLRPGQPGVVQTWHSHLLAQVPPVPAAAGTAVVTIPGLSPSRSAMPTMSAYLPAEEQRLLNALEVLNRRLKISDDVGATDTMTDVSTSRAAVYRGHLPWPNSQPDGSSTRLEDLP